MTPAINALEKAGIAYELLEYHHDTDNRHFGEEAVEQLGLDASLVFKTLVVESEKQQLAVAIIPVDTTLDLKQVAKQLKTKKVKMANPSTVERQTGYVLGGVSPVGQKKSLPTLIDQSAERLPALHVSAGRRGLEVKLSPTDLKVLLQASYAPIGMSK